MLNKKENLREIYQRRIISLKKIIEQYELDGYLLNSTDEYLNEYTPEHSKRLNFITGFSGSNGIAIITVNHCLFFTDGRYIEQSKKELDQDVFSIFNQMVIINISKESKINKEKVKIGFDPNVFSQNTIKIWQAKEEIELIAINDNLIDIIWQDRPLQNNCYIELYDEKFAGRSHIEKINELRYMLKKNDADGIFIATPESICWLLNIRGRDLEFSPILLCRALITENKIYLFANNVKNSDFNLLKNHKLEILDIAELKEFLQNWQGKIIFHSNETNLALVNLLKMKKEALDIKNDPCLLAKACKNQLEIEANKKIHIYDSVALCEFFAFLSNLYKNQDNKNIQINGNNKDIYSLTEYDLGIILTNYRKNQPNYIMDSFPAICGLNENGAIIHYRATKEGAKKINQGGLLLIDSGGQYHGGTTDITRTIWLENSNNNDKEFKASNEQKTRYTDVLKGHIAIATALFPAFETSGARLDVLARYYLWQNGLDYAHGTGHGVGNFLNVHEGPQRISAFGDVILQEGMILSNEPGYYLPQKYGIRIENLLYIKASDKKNFLAFENLSLVPYANDLIDFDSLNKTEINYLKQYYQIIQDKIMPLLSEQAKKWLAAELKIILSI